MTTAEAIGQTASIVPPLSILSEAERELAESVYQFALETIKPRALAMDQANVIDPGLVRKFFELDLMGIEVAAV